MRRAFAFGVALLCAMTVRRAEGETIPHGSLELIAQKQWIAAGHTIDVGLHFQLEKGWHIYWINPGDSGEPPRVEWRLPPGLSAGLIEWPAPRRFETSSTLVDYGYLDDVLLIVPIRAEPRLANPTAQVGAEVKLLICSHEMCVPAKAQVSLTLPVKSEPGRLDARNTCLFQAARKFLPRPAPAKWKFTVSDTNGSFLLAGKLGHRAPNAVFFPLLESQIENAAPQKFVPVATGFRMTLRKSDQLLKPITRLKGVLVLAGDQAYLIDVPVSEARAASGPGIRFTSA